MKNGKLEGLDAHSIESIAEVCDRYGFESHSKKMLSTLYYKSVREYDNTVEKYKLDEDQPFSAVYQTGQTRKLDALFGLEGKPVGEDKARDLISPSFWIGKIEQEIVMPKFASVAAQAGIFVGLPMEEVSKTFGVSNRELEDSVREGYLEKFEHEGITVVAPTDKYRPFGSSILESI